MITLISGTPGGGKSLKAAYQVIEDLNFKKRVITNYEVNLAAYNKRFAAKNANRLSWYLDEEMTVKNLVLFALKNHKPCKEHQTSIYLDEPDFFNPRDWARGDRRPWIQFLRLHRKLGYDIYIITQDECLVDKQIRKFIEIERRCRAVKHYKTFGWILSLVSGGLFVYNDTWYGAKSKLSISHGFYRLHKRKAMIYDSFNCFGSFDGFYEEILGTTAEEQSPAEEEIQPI